MTIVAVAVAPDGIVLAGDGRATLRGGRRHRIRTDEAQKVFAPYPGVGIATYGSALIGHSTISGLVRSFVARRSSEAGTLADDVAGDLREFAEDAIAAEAKRSGLGLKQVGFLVAGYDGRGVGQVREVVVPGLPNGLHDFEGVKTGYEPDRKQILIAPGQESTVTLRIRYARQIKKSAVDLNDQGEKLLFTRRSSLSPRPCRDRPDSAAAPDARRLAPSASPTSK